MQSSSSSSQGVSETNENDDIAFPLFPLAWASIVETLALASINEKGNDCPVSIRDLLNSIPDELKTEKVIQYSKEFLGILVNPPNSNKPPNLQDDDSMMPSPRLVRYVLGVDESELEDDSKLGILGYKLLRIIGRTKGKGISVEAILKSAKAGGIAELKDKDRVNEKLTQMIKSNFIVCSSGSPALMYLPRFHYPAPLKTFLELTKPWPKLLGSYLDSLRNSIHHARFQGDKNQRKIAQGVHNARISLTVIFRMLAPKAPAYIRFLTELELDYLYQVEESDLRVVRSANSETPFIEQVSHPSSSNNMSISNYQELSSSLQASVPETQEMDRSSHFFIYRPEAQIQAILSDQVYNIIRNGGSAGCSINELIKYLKLPPDSIQRSLDTLEKSKGNNITTFLAPTEEKRYLFTPSLLKISGDIKRSDSSLSTPSNKPKEESGKSEDSKYTTRMYEKALFASFYGSDFESNDKDDDDDDDDEDAVADDHLSDFLSEGSVEEVKDILGTTRDHDDEEQANSLEKRLNYIYKLIKMNKCLTVRVLWAKMMKTKLQPKMTRKQYCDAVKMLVEALLVNIYLDDYTDPENFEEFRTPFYLALRGTEVNKQVFEDALNAQSKLKNGKSMKPFRFLSKKAMKRLLKRSTFVPKEKKPKKAPSSAATTTNSATASSSSKKKKDASSEISLDIYMESSFMEFEMFETESSATPKKRKKPPMIASSGVRTSQIKKRRKKTPRLKSAKVVDKLDVMSGINIDLYIQLGEPSTIGSDKENLIIVDSPMVLAAQIKILQCLLTPYEAFSEQMMDTYLSCFGDRQIIVEAMRQLIEKMFVRLRPEVRNQKAIDHALTPSRYFHLFEPSNNFMNLLQNSEDPFSERMKKEFVEFERKWSNRKMEHSIQIPHNTSGGSVAAILTSLVEGRVSLRAKFHSKVRIEHSDAPVQISEVASIHKYEPAVTLELSEPVYQHQHHHANHHHHQHHHHDLLNRFRDAHVLTSYPASDADLLLNDNGSKAVELLEKCKQSKSEGITMTEEELSLPEIRELIYGTGDLVRIPCGDNFRIISREFAQCWLSLDVSKLNDSPKKLISKHSTSSFTSSSPSFDSRRPVVANIWLNVDGSINGDVFAHLSWKALSIVENKPGIPHNEIIEMFEPLLHSSNAELLLEQMSQEGILFSRHDDSGNSNNNNNNNINFDGNGNNSRRCWFGVRLTRRIPL